jgi:hypothetical protein
MRFTDPDLLRLAMKPKPDNFFVLWRCDVKKKGNAVGYFKIVLPDQKYMIWFCH